MLLACVVAVFLGSLGILLQDHPHAYGFLAGLELGSAYFLIVLSALPFNIYLAYRSVSQGSGTANPPQSSAAHHALNVVLDPFLIHGWLGLPALGVLVPLGPPG